MAGDESLIDTTCSHCGLRRYQCADCGHLCFTDDPDEELCTDCFRSNRVAQLEEQMNRARALLVPPYHIPDRFAEWANEVDVFLGSLGK